MKKIFLIIAVLALYVATSELNAKRKAEEFCESIKLGESTEGIMEAGIESGASQKESEITSGKSPYQFIFVGFTGFVPGSSFSCRITSSGGVSTNKRIHARSLASFAKDK